jgi:hypothetical protein
VASSFNAFMGVSASKVQERRAAEGRGCGQAPSAKRSLNCRTQAFVRRIKHGDNIVKDASDVGKFEVGIFICCDGEFCCEEGLQCSQLAGIAEAQFAALPSLSAPQLYTHLRSLPEGKPGGPLCAVSKSACNLALWRLRRKHKAATGVAVGDLQRTMASFTLRARVCVRAFFWHNVAHLSQSPPYPRPPPPPLSPAIPAHCPFFAFAP